MVDEELVHLAYGLVGDERLADHMQHYVEVAKGAVIDCLFPNDSEATWEDVPEKYHSRVVEIAVYLANRRGSEGETSHSESGTQRTYESAGIPKSYFRGMIPRVGVPR